MAVRKVIVTALFAAANAGRMGDEDEKRQSPYYSDEGSMDMNMDSSMDQAEEGSDMMMMDQGQQQEYAESEGMDASSMEAESMDQSEDMMDAQEPGGGMFSRMKSGISSGMSSMSAGMASMKKSMFGKPDPSSGRPSGAATGGMDDTGNGVKATGGMDDDDVPPPPPPGKPGMFGGMMNRFTGMFKEPQSEMDPMFRLEKKIQKIQMWMVSFKERLAKKDGKEGKGKEGKGKEGKGKEGKKAEPKKGNETGGN